MNQNSEVGWIKRGMQTNAATGGGFTKGFSDMQHGGSASLDPPYNSMLSAESSSAQ